MKKNNPNDMVIKPIINHPICDLQTYHYYYCIF